jgi:hypothetical protein
MRNGKSYRYLCLPYKLEDNRIIETGKSVPINSKFSLVNNKNGLEYTKRECQKIINFELSGILIFPVDNKDEEIFICE